MPTTEQKAKAKSFAQTFLGILAKREWQVEGYLIKFKETVTVKLAKDGFHEITGIEVEIFGPNPGIHGATFQVTNETAFLIIDVPGTDKRIDIAEWF